MTAGCDTPPPTRNAPPPNPPPEPGPKPAPVPDPIPPPLPDPIPPPEPIPLDGGPSAARGLPIFGMLLLGTSRGAMIVGSMVSLGCSLRTTSVGGTNCLVAILGNLPFASGMGDRLPPPPPPCEMSFWGFKGSRTGAISVTVSWSFCCTVLLKDTVNSSATKLPCSAREYITDFGLVA